MNGYLYSEPRRRVRRRRRVPLWPFLLLAAVILLAVYPFLEARGLSVDEHTLQVSGLPANLKNLKILYASDFHFSGQWAGSRAEKAVGELNGLSADIIILGGDYGTNTEEAIRFFKELPSIYARIGVYAVLGDTDYSDPGRVAELVGVIQGRGILPLVNAVASVKIGQNYLYIAGADDFNESVPMVDALAAHLREEDFVIFAAHSPDVVNAVHEAKTAAGSSHWFDLALMGHTHGGQINVLGRSLCPKLMPAEVSDRYARGWLEENRAALLTSNGVGTEGLPARLGARPQIHRITLKAR